MAEVSARPVAASRRLTLRTGYDLTPDVDPIADDPDAWGWCYRTRPARRGIR